MTQQEAVATFNIVIGMVVMFDTKACMLINLGATYSFISCEFIACVGLTLVPLNYRIKICTSAGESL